MSDIEMSELRAALGWPGEPDNPIFDRNELLKMVAELRVFKNNFSKSMADMKARLELVASQLNAAWSKSNDAPLAAHSHLQEAAFAVFSLCKVTCVFRE
jgi:hypothetical protein